MTLLLTSMLLALLVSALCSFLEATLLSLSPTQVAQLSASHPQAGKTWQQFRQQIERPIAVILVVNTAAHTMGATIAGAQFEILFGQGGILWFSILFTYLMLQFTEVLPKTLGVQYNAVLAPWIAFPLAMLVRVLTPVIWLIHFVNRPFTREQPSQTAAPLEEIASLAGLARLTNLISPHQERIIQGTSQLSLKKAEDVMIPIEQVTFLSTAQTLSAAIATAHADPHTRFPICEGDDRNWVIGYVNFKDLIYEQRISAGESSLEQIVRPVHFVSSQQPANELLKAFVERHEHMAIVREANGQILGLVTLEDVIEELVGELEDEYDRLPKMIYSLKGGSWTVGGGLPIQELANRLGVHLPDAQGTTSAWLIRRCGRIPKPNDVHHEPGVQFHIRRTRRGQVFEVSVIIDNPLPGKE